MLPRVGAGEVLLKGPLASLERHDRPAFEGRSGSERSTEPGSSAKTVASQPVVGYRIRSRTAKKEILDHYHQTYGSEEIDTKPLLVKSATVSPDGLRVRLVVDGLRKGYVHELHADGVRSAGGEKLLHAAGYYTLNELPR